MSPVGGVGINLAIQDAVAAANILAGPLRAGRAPDADLARVQHRREGPVKLIQAVQMAVQNRVLGPILKADRPLEVPLAVRLLDRSRWLRQFPARAVGMGWRMEHVRTTEAAPR